MLLYMRYTVHHSYAGTVEAKCRQTPWQHATAEPPGLQGQYKAHGPKQEEQVPEPWTRTLIARKDSELQDGPLRPHLNKALSPELEVQ